MVAKCEQVWHEISNYLEGDVDAGMRAAMDEHFHSCAKCQSLLEGTRNVIRLYADERMIEVPTGFGGRLERRLVQGARVRARGWSPWSAWLVPAAALVLIAGGFRVANSLSVPHPMMSEHAQPAHGVPPNLVVIVSADAKEFHVQGCTFIHNKDKERTLTAKEAMQQGYVPCVHCMRKYLESAAAGATPMGRTALELEAEAYLDMGREEFYEGQ
jgi:hypothetical protein